MTIDLKMLRETGKARLFERLDGGRIWVPKSVTNSRPTTLLPHASRVGHWVRVEIEDWFLEKNWHSHWSACACGHVTAYPHTFFAGGKPLECVNCAELVPVPTLRC